MQHITGQSDLLSLGTSLYSKQQPWRRFRTRRTWQGSQQSIWLKSCIFYNNKANQSLTINVDTWNVRVEEKETNFSLYWVEKKWSSLMDSTIELGRGDVYAKSWSKRRYSLSSSSGGSWLTLVSISDVDFCLRSSRDLLWQLLALSWQSTWTFILHTRHFKPWRVWPTKKEGEPNDWLSDWYLLPLWCSHAHQPTIKIDWVLAAWRLVNVYNSFASRCSECRDTDRILRVVAPVAAKNACRCNGTDEIKRAQSV